MLLQLENTSDANVKKLLDYARQLNLHLRLVDQDDSKTSLPGKPLSESALNSMIESSRQSGIINMKDAHNTIRKNFNAG